MVEGRSSRMLSQGLIQWITGHFRNWRTMTERKRMDKITTENDVMMRTCATGTTNSHQQEKNNKKQETMSSNSKSDSPLLLDNQRMSLPSFDIDEPSSASDPSNNNNDLTAEVLHVVGEGLNQVEELLQELEENPDLLGPAILRKCNEFADGIGHLVNELEQHSEEERRMLADACQEECSEVMLAENQDALTQNQWMNAIDGATALLKDVQSAFRDVGDDDAQEIADVALMVARVFLMSLQSFHASIELPPSSSVQIQELSDNSSNPPRSPVKEDGEIYDSTSRGFDDAGSASPMQQQQGRKSTKTKRRQDRVRVLWPPLGPQVAAACDRGKESATKQPLLAVALGLTLWPAAIGTAIVGGSIVLADGVLQDVYNHFQQTSILKTVEEGAAHLYHTSRLMLVTAKFGTRQTLRIVNKQVDRHGGVGQIAQNATSFVIDRAVHPIETIGMAWNGLNWGVGMVSDTIQDVMEQQRDQKVMEQEL
eukprot:scaffold2141_cov120-Cylindrotheca_fusiformis.AAC.24